MAGQGPARPVWRTAAAANLALFTEAERRLTEANDSPAGEVRAIAWHLAMARRSQGNESAAVAGMVTNHSPRAQRAAALKDPSYRLKTTTAEHRIPRSNPGSVVTGTTPGRERPGSPRPGPNSTAKLGLTRVKNQIERYRAATLMARVRAAKGMKAQPSKHMIFTDRPVPARPRSRVVVANISGRLSVITKPKLVETSRKGLVAEYEGNRRSRPLRRSIRRWAVLSSTRLMVRWCRKTAADRSAEAAHENEPRLAVPSLSR